MTAPPKALQRPALISLEDQALDPDLDPGLAPPLPGEDMAAPGGAALEVLARRSARRASPLGRVALWVLGLLLPLVLSVAAYDFAARLMAANSLLGWVGSFLLGAAAVVLVLLALREGAAILRLSRIEALQARAAPARQDLAAARALAEDIARLYRGRGDTAWGLARLQEEGQGVMDGDALLDLVETRLLAELDKAALAEVEAAARQIALVTALVPMALVDVAAAAFANLRMIRRLSEIYGGRSSFLGSLRLMRRVFAAVLGAGAVALGDDVLGSLASGGVLAKLSRRFGEGVVNGALTVRVGIAAIETCRPLPFGALPRPTTGATTSRALAGILRRSEAGGDAA